MLKLYRVGIDKKESDGRIEQQSNVSVSGKYKLWKLDYYRDRDRESMQDISNQLRRLRKKSNPKSKRSSGKVQSKPQSGITRHKASFLHKAKK